MTDQDPRIAALAEAIHGIHSWDYETRRGEAADILAALPPDWCGHARPPRNTRLVLVTEDADTLFFGRSDAGNLLTFEWGTPDENGWYTPTITEHSDQPLPDLARLRTIEAAAREVTAHGFVDSDPEGLGGEWCHFCDEQTLRHATGCDWTALRAALGEAD